jgi:streptogramin lyase
MSTSGARTEFVGLNADPQSICVGSDGNLWFSEPGRGIGRITPAGSITEFLPPQNQIFPGVASGLCLASDGAVWFGANESLGRITSAGDFLYVSYGSQVFVQDLCLGPNGNLWATNVNPASVSQMNGGTATFYPAGTSTSLGGICSGPDSSLWFTDSSNSTGKVCRITTTGVITNFFIANNVGLSGICTGPDNNLWFGGGFGVGRTTSTGVATLFQSGISGPVLSLCQGQTIGSGSPSRATTRSA